MMSPKQLIESNLAVVTEVAPDVVARFYAKLFERHPHLQRLFGRRSQGEQERMLTEAILAVVGHMEDAAWLKGVLRPLGAKHVGYGVTEGMYPLVADALVDTLREASGPAWSPEVEQAWSGALGAVAGEMIAGAREAESQRAGQTLRVGAAPPSAP
jgi:hemoglobin-like flavoprotein